MTGVRLLLDEHVGRVLEQLLRERGHDVTQAKDEFGENTEDATLLEWCATNEVVLVTNNAKDFEPLAGERAHAGILLYYDQSLPETDPEGLAQAIDEVFTQYGMAGVTNELVDLGEWHDWLTE